VDLNGDLQIKTDLKELFIQKWEYYFPGASLPVCYFYTDASDIPASEKCEGCVYQQLNKVREGESICLNKQNIGCGGGRRYLGFAPQLGKKFRYFLSKGIPGEMEGERYKATPEIVDEIMKHTASFKAPSNQIVFKRWDKLGETDEPQVVIFFTSADVLSGLFTLVNYDESHPQAVFTPFGSGCATIIYYPFQEINAERPRAVLGSFDVSARPFLSPGELTLAIPWPKFIHMVENMDESFLITNSWKAVQARMQKST
jgi:hypothetical protein